MPRGAMLPVSNSSFPWRAVILFSVISVGATTAIALLTAAKGWTVASPAWGLLAPIAMWAPAFARLVSQRTVDRGFVSTLRLRHWGISGSRVVLRPLAIPLLVYGPAYAIAWSTGLAHWSPGEGRWTTGAQIAANLVVNLTILGVYGTFTAMGEELGWRGYLQPRLDAARVRSSLIVVWLIQLAYHAPLMLGTEYVNVGSFTTSVALFAIGDLAFTFLAARESYLARSLWPAVFFHSFHNTISQWLFPKFFTVAADQIWIRGEDGLLPMAGYALLGLAAYITMRRRGETWSALASSCLNQPNDVRPLEELRPSQRISVMK
jgi:membrane protease YdiL (CAAX protease family)